MNTSTTGSNLPGTPGEPTPRQQRPAAAQQPGQWPLGCSNHVQIQASYEPGGEDWLTLQAERASRIVVLGRIRAHLESEPSPRAVRASASRWGRYITALAEDVVTTMNESARADS